MLYVVLSLKHKITIMLILLWCGHINKYRVSTIKINSYLLTSKPFLRNIDVISRYPTNDEADVNSSCKKKHKIRLSKYKILDSCVVA